jgi:hypothetical protein
MNSQARSASPTHGVQDMRSPTGHTPENYATQDVVIDIVEEEPVIPIEPIVQHTDIAFPICLILLLDAVTIYIIYKVLGDKF